MNRQAKRQWLFGVGGAAVGAAATILVVALTSTAHGTLAKQAAEPAQRPEKAAKPPRKYRRKVVESRSPALAWEQLQALGYVDGTYDPNIERANVLVHDVDAAHPGYNFYSSRRDRGARLLRMDGTPIHEWKAKEKGAWQHAELLPNGDVLVIVKDRRLARYDQESRLKWSVKGRFHHDLWIHEGEIYVLAREIETIESIHPKIPILVDVIRVFSMDGELRREISVLEALRRSKFAFLLPSVSHKRDSKKGRALDVLHTNHVEVLDGSRDERGPMYAAGNVLVSMRNINAIAILEPSSAEVVWIWGPTNVAFQHHPTMLENGHILLFDNGVKRSRVIELDPISGEIVWQYAPGPSFFSATRGSNQRLANGNTLITESDRGYVFEVTPDGKVVWKFANPAVRKKDKTRDAIWRMVRVDPDSLAFLD